MVLVSKRHWAARDHNIHAGDNISACALAGLGKQDVSSQHIGGGGASNYCSALGVKEMMVQISIIFASAPSLIYHSFVLHLPVFGVKIFVQI